jgi:Flp pilus assembly protein TadG
MKGFQRSRARGGALVEFALTLPLLALLIFGIIQYGFIFAAYMTLRNASMMAARRAILSNPTPTQTDVQNTAIAAIQPMLNPVYLVTNSVSSTTVIVNGTSVTATNVTLVYNLPLIVPFVVPGKTAGGSLKLTATSIMR